MARVGDIFSIPLGNGRVAIGQIVAKSATPAPCLILVCKATFPETQLPSESELQRSVCSEPVILANSFDVLVDNGDWKILGNFPPALDTLKLPAFRNIGELPFAFTVTTYDLKYVRVATRLKEMFAPSHYSISPKWLEDVVKAYFGLGKWNAKHDKLLYKNIVPFGKLRGKKLPPEPPLGHLVLAKIMDNVLPMARGKKYEGPLDEALRSRGFGSVTGGGTQTNRERGVAWIGLDIELSNLDEALEFTRQKLRELGAPAGSVLEYRVGEKRTAVQIT